MQIRYPFRVDPRGRTSGTTDEQHIEGLIEQVLFTSPGERVNRPTFGSGLMNLVFAPASEAMAAAVQQIVQSALQQWLGEVIQVEAVSAEQQDTTLSVTVVYALRKDGQRRVATLAREV